MVTSGTDDEPDHRCGGRDTRESQYNHERVAHARSVAAATGRQLGRPRKMTDDQVRRASGSLDAGHSLAAAVAAVAGDFGVDKSTLHRRVKAQRANHTEETPK